MAELLKDWADLSQALMLKKVPHDSTLAYAEIRLLKIGLLTYCSDGRLRACFLATNDCWERACSQDIDQHKSVNPICGSSLITSYSSWLLH